MNLSKSVVLPLDVDSYRDKNLEKYIKNKCFILSF
jgi:hypothetical protein